MRSSATGCGGGCARSCGCRTAARLRAGHDYVLVGRRAALNCRLPGCGRFRAARCGACMRDGSGTTRQIAMMDNKNTILAIVLSAMVLLGWQYFFAMPQQKAASSRRSCSSRSSRRAQQPSQAQPGARRQPGAPARPAHRAARRDRAGAARRRAPARSRDARGSARRLAARADRNRRLNGSIALKGGAHRRPLAGQIPRDRRPEFAADRAAVALRQPRPVLRRVRLDAGRRHHRQAAQRRTRCGSRKAPARSTLGHPVTLT